MEVDLSRYSSGNFDRGAGRLKEGLWLLTSLWLFRFCPLKLSGLKSAVLRAFGARVGRGVVIKPGVKITFPWKLTLGNHVWLGEDAWLLNLAPIVIEDHVCISQGALLCTGNHDYASATFDLIVKPITIQRGAWVAANAFVAPGITLGNHAVLTAGSVAVSDLLPAGIYRGNPATLVRQRVIREMAR